MVWSTYAVATSKGLATCIAVNTRNPSAPHEIVPVLVTSAHVLSTAPHGPFYVVMRIPDSRGNPKAAILELNLPPTAEPIYVKHPRHDVAAFALRIPPELAGTVRLRSFINENAIAHRGSEAHVGDEISLLGFPRVFPGTEGGFAVLRDGKIASYATGPPRDREKFLVNTNVYAGDSGGPVFKGRRLGTPKVVGLVIERIGEKIGSVPLAVAVNATVIRETLQLLKRRETMSAARTPIGGFASSTHRPSTVKLIGPPASFTKAARANPPVTIPVSPEN